RRKRWTAGGDSCASDFCLDEGRTQKATVAMLLVEHGQATGLSRSQMLLLVRMSCDGECSLVPKYRMSQCQEKFLVRESLPVPQTDTGSRGENPKVSERTFVKELGKMTP